MYLIIYRDTERVRIARRVIAAGSDARIDAAGKPEVLLMNDEADFRIMRSDEFHRPVFGMIVDDERFKIIRVLSPERVQAGF